MEHPCGNLMTSAQCWAATITYYHTFVAVVAVACLAVLVDLEVRVRRLTARGRC